MPSSVIAAVVAGIGTAATAGTAISFGALALHAAVGVVGNFVLSAVSRALPKKPN